MKEYTISYIETFESLFTIEAETYEEAEEKLLDMLMNGEENTDKAHMIALYHYRHDTEKNGVVYSYKELIKETFSPLPCDVLILDGTRKAGTTYKERKAQIEEQAAEYSKSLGEMASVRGVMW